jgi:hypothetical protein
MLVTLFMPAVRELLLLAMMDTLCRVLRTEKEATESKMFE